MKCARGTVLFERHLAQLQRALTVAFAFPDGTFEFLLQVIDLAQGWSDSVTVQLALADLLATLACVYIHVKLHFAPGQGGRKGEEKREREKRDERKRREKREGEKEGEKREGGKGRREKGEQRAGEKRRGEKEEKNRRVAKKGERKGREKRGGRKREGKKRKKKGEKK